MPPTEQPLIIGVKGIMAFLQIANWDSVVNLIEHENLPFQKIGGRWVGKRENLQHWLDVKTGLKDMESVEVCRIRHTSTHNSGSKAHIWTRWRTVRMERFLIAYREYGCQVSRACRQAGINRKTFYNWQREYERFAFACQQIQNEVYGDGQT